MYVACILYTIFYDANNIFNENILLYKSILRY